MKKIRTTPPRHFPYQHPTFGTDKKPKTPRHWEDTVYYWWWAYLRRSEKYLKTCELGGKGELAKLYKDFGDVRGDSFKAWWNEKLSDDNSRGAHLFANPIKADRLTLLEDGEKAVVNKSKLVISVPLNLPQKFLVDRFRKLVEENHNGAKGMKYAKASEATYKFSGQPNIKALRIGLKIYDSAKANPDLTLWELGLDLPQFQEELSQYKKDSIPFDLRRTISSTVSRYKKRVAESIRNTELGFFPNRDES